jgi:hypothetical protein
MRKRFCIKWKLRAIAAPRGVKDVDMAEHLGVSPQSFSYKMKNGFSKAEVMALCAYLGINERDGLL